MYAEKFRLDGKLAVVTGGGGAIGFEIARAFAEAGAAVVVADRDSAAVADAVERLAAEGARRAARFSMSSIRTRSKRRRRRSKKKTGVAPTFWLAPRESRAPKRRPKKSPTSIGGRFWTLI